MVSKFRVATLTGGGDTQALNATLFGMAKAVSENGGELIGFRRGWAGALYPGKDYYVHGEDEKGSTIKRLNDKTGEYVFLTPEVINPNQGGSIIFSSRTDLRKIPGALEEVGKRMKEMAIDYFLPIGGDDTNTVTLNGLKEGIFNSMSVMPVPKTIDNDVGRNGSNGHLGSLEHMVNIWTPGHPTASLKGRRFVEATYSTAYTHERVYWVEVMGRTAGWLSLATSHLGKSHLLIVPEDPIFIEDINQRVLELYKQFGFFYGIVAEGAIDAATSKPLASNSKLKDTFGNEKLHGASSILTAANEIYFKGHGVSVPYFNAQIPEYMFRGGGPITEDRDAAISLGYHAVTKLLADKKLHGHMAILKWDGKNVRPDTLPLEEAVVVAEGNIIKPRTLPINRQNPEKGFYDPRTKLPTQLGRSYVDLFGIPQIKFQVWQGQVHQ